MIFKGKNNQSLEEFDKATSIIEQNSKNLKQFNTKEFNKKTKSWENTNTSKGYNEISDLSFITYNVWFDPHNWNNRLKELFNIFQNYSPDFICLQEVTRHFIASLLNNQHIRDNYIVTENSIASYDVLILYKRKFRSSVNVFSIDFPSRMGRKLLLAELSIKTKDHFQTVLIGTSHFESLYENYMYRAKQLNISFDLLDLCRNSFLMGDFNYDPILNYKEEENINSNKYADAWKEHVKKNLISGEEAKGTTYPQEDNIPPTRLDRIYYNKYGAFELSDIKIIGDTPIQVESNNYSNPVANAVNTPSDHKGIYTKFFF